MKSQDGKIGKLWNEKLKAKREEVKSGELDTCANSHQSFLIIWVRNFVWFMHVKINRTVFETEDIVKYGSDSEKYEKCYIHQRHYLNESDKEKMVLVSMYYQQKEMKKWLVQS